MNSHWSAPYVQVLKDRLPRDLAALPVYFVDEADVGRDHLPDRVSTVAFQRFDMDRLCEESLRTLRLWQGPGCVVFLNRDAAWRQQCSIAAMLGLMVHEVAHYFDRWADGLRSQLSGNSSIPSIEQPANPDEQPEWHNHEWGFVRAAIHMASRAKVPFRDIGFAGLRYGLSPAEVYAESLKAEIDNCADELLLSVLTRDPPARFLQLWEDDTSNRQPDTLPRAAQEFVAGFVDQLLSSGQTLRHEAASAAYARQLQQEFLPSLPRLNEQCVSEPNSITTETKEAP